jgi:hypothetical protein
MPIAALVNLAACRISCCTFKQKGFKGARRRFNGKKVLFVGGASSRDPVAARCRSHRKTDLF